MHFPPRPSAARFTLLLGLLLASIPTHAADYTLMGWNDLGMHCMDGKDFSVFSVLPPFNTIHAQLTYRGSLVTNTTGVTVTFEAIADATGSINRTSQGKGNFWEYAEALFGNPLAADVGLAGVSMPGTNNQPQPMVWDAAAKWFTAEGIPITPYDDQLRKNYYPMMRLVAKNTAGTVLARTDIVLPVSDEMDCRACHRSGSSDAAQPPSGWSWECDPERDYKLNILRRHDETRPTSSVYISALNRVGYNPAGLVATVVQDGKPVLCLRCHPSNALPGSGTTGMRPFTRVIHGQHALVNDPETGLSLNDTANRASCYRCHPGRDTRCLRGTMGDAVAPDGTRSIQCQDCHGNLSAVAATGRKGWLDEPNCQSCHTGTAADNNGQIRYDSVFESPGVVRQAVDLTFATQPDTPTNGVSLYRFSRGHGGLYCAACHGSPHAEYPSSHANDNVQSTQLQGHRGVLVECSTCHASTPATVNGGPHGMHPVGSTWISGHKTPGKSPTQCQACHGTDYRGTVLSLSQADRTLTAFGTKRFWRGFRIGCYNCHNGASSNNQNSNRPASVSNTSATTTADQPVAINLTATDADNNPLTLRIVSQPSHGTVALANRQATYYPEPGYAGPDSFTFAAWDGSTDSNLGTVSLSVNQGNCLLTASGTAPVSGQTGTALPFHADALLSRCATNISFVWTFGDGTTATNQADACHLYAQPGTYAWTLVATAGAATQTIQGVITIAAAPTTDVLLTITDNGTMLEISWPGDATGYALESTGDLNSPIAWQPAGSTPQWIAGRWIVTLPKPLTSQFYRLRK